MNGSLKSIFESIDSQKTKLSEELYSWCNINTGTYNFEGQLKLQKLITEKLFQLPGKTTLKLSKPYTDLRFPSQNISLPIAPVLLYSIRPRSRFKILFGIHQDTVFNLNHHFQSSRLINNKTLHAPGCADAKGGLLVLLNILKNLEYIPGIKKIGYTAFVNSDEEIGSPGSVYILKQLARTHQFGFLYEPTLEDGSLVDSRGGSGKFTFHVLGKSAHVGRNFSDGVSAISVFNKFYEDLTTIINRKYPDSIINLGLFQGGEALNCVPLNALAKVNIRTPSIKDMNAICHLLHSRVKHYSKGNNQKIPRISVSGSFHCPPKPVNAGTQHLIKCVKSAATLLNANFQFRHSNGVSDGNKLHAFGCPNLDTMGVHGKYIHTDREIVYIDSIPEKIKLSLLTVNQLISKIPEG